MADPVPCAVCGTRFVPSVGRSWCSVGCEAAVRGDSPAPEPTDDAERDRLLARVRVIYGMWQHGAKINDETLAYERGRIAAMLKQTASLKARAERAEARLQQLLEHGYPTWDVKGAPKSQWHERDAYAAVDHVLNVAEMYFSGGRRSTLLLARESWEAVYGRAQAAELEIAVLRAELDGLRPVTP